jgi:hypothetical protein
VTLSVEAGYAKPFNRRNAYGACLSRGASAFGVVVGLLAELDVRSACGGRPRHRRLWCGHRICSLLAFAGVVAAWMCRSSMLMGSALLSGCARLDRSN